MSKFKNIKIRAYLQSEVITDGYCPLDAPLYSHMIRDLLGQQHISKPLESSVRESLGVYLPILKQNTKSDNWFYACSFAQWSKGFKRSKQMKTRRFDIEDGMKYIGFKKGRKVETGKGAYKNYFINEYTISAAYVDWFLVADVELLNTLLPFVKHIGKKSSGAVTRFEVEDWHSDWSVRGYEDNRLMRSVPISKENTPVYGLRPSYWNPKHQTRVVLPKIATSLID